MSYRIETDRLVLRGLKNPDVDLLIELLGNHRVTHWLFSGKPMDARCARAFIEKEFTFGNDGLGLGTLCEKGPERFVGFAGIIPCRYLGVEDLEFGVALLEDSWGKGYAREIGEAQIKYGFENLSADRLLALAHPENTASLKGIEALGMRFIKDIFTEERGPRRVYVIERRREKTGSPAGSCPVVAF
ncbi:MAG TPA: GNAT family N-acetyltransferase [Syntrophobacteraceae bacterium]|nr:GNAT family N-acetyltransferase [Syntrophobacteraceae bacterium]